MSYFCIYIISNGNLHQGEMIPFWRGAKQSPNLTTQHCCPNLYFGSSQSVVLFTSLIKYYCLQAWQLWNEGKVLELMDPLLLKDSCSPNEFLRYIHIGLLCVQEDANNRPTMSSVVLMLKTETISLSKPERPAFFTGRSENHHHQIGAYTCSVNGLTVSDDMPR